MAASWAPTGSGAIMPGCNRVGSIFFPPVVTFLLGEVVGQQQGAGFRRTTGRNRGRLDGTPSGHAFLRSLTRSMRTSSTVVLRVSRPSSSSARARITIRYQLGEVGGRSTEQVFRSDRNIVCGINSPLARASVWNVYLRRREHHPRPAWGTRYISDYGSGYSGIPL